MTSPRTTSCCDTLQRNAESDGDLTLVALVRLTGIISDVLGLMREPRVLVESQHDHLLLLGLETKFRDIRQNLQPHIASTSMFTVIPAPLLCHVNPMLRYPF